MFKASFRVKINRGLGVQTPGVVIDPLWKSAEMGLEGSVLDNLQQNNSLTHTDFQYFTYLGKISKYDPLEKFDLPLEKSLIFTLASSLFYASAL